MAEDFLYDLKILLPYERNQDRLALIAQKIAYGSTEFITEWTSCLL